MALATAAEGDATAAMVVRSAASLAAFRPCPSCLGEGAVERETCGS